MPAVAPGSKVLVTGANGYIAIWVVRTLLEGGYSVRGTVRSDNKAVHLRETFKSYGDKHEVVVVEDITKDGAFDEAVKGVDAIEHTASPFHLKADHPDELIGPAVKGTTGVLQSALKYGTNVKRIVVTSSVAAVINPATNTPTVFSEKDWNDQAIQEVEEKGRGAPQMAKYRASKTLAERAAWAFVEKNKGQIKWDLATLNPPYVLGPIIHWSPTKDHINTSMLDLYNTIVKGDKDENALATVGGAWVDVRDLARAHLLAIEKPEAGGERFIVSAGAFKWQDFVDAANSLEPPVYTNLIQGRPGAGSAPGVVHLVNYDNLKAKKVLGLESYITKKESVKDCLEDFKRRGW